MGNELATAITTAHKYLVALIVLAFLCVIHGCSRDEVSDPETSAPTKDATVYIAQNVITMNADNSQASAVAVADGQILAVGNVASIEKALPDYSLVVDDRFADKVLMPGFIDNHLHPALAGILLPADFITPFPWNLPNQQVPGVQGRDAYLQSLIKLEASLDDPDEMLITWGYHQFFHGDITRTDINQISSSRPIIVWQRSFHEIFANDAALDILGITAEEYGDHPAIDLANGHFWETGLFSIFPRLVPIVLEPARFRSGILVGLVHAQQNGITTLCDQGVPLLDLETEMQALERVITDHDLPLRMLLVGNAKSLGLSGNREALEIMESLPLLGNTAPAWTESAALPGGDIANADFTAFLASFRKAHPWLPRSVRLDAVPTTRSALVP